MRTRSGRMSPRAKVLTALCVAIVTFCGVPAAADGGSMVADVLGPFNLTDAHGLRVDQYQLNIDMGSRFEPMDKALAALLHGIWTCYAWWIALVAWAVNYVTDLEWVKLIAGAFSSASDALRENVLAPLGGTTPTGQLIGLLLGVCGLTCLWLFFRRGTGAAVSAALAGSIAAALAAGVLLTPVATMVGTSQTLAKPVENARQFQAEVVEAVAGQEDQTLGGMLIDSFVRPAHQVVNYGTVIDGQSCEDGSSAEEAYNDALKKGPVDTKKNDIRKAVGDCQSSWKEYADKPHPGWLFLLNLFTISGFIVGVMALIFVLLLWLMVLAMVWAAFKSTYHVLYAIVSPQAWAPLVRDLLNVVVGLVYVVTGSVVLTLILRVVRAAFAADQQIVIRFLLADAVGIGGAILLIVNALGHRRWGRKLAAKIRAGQGGQSRIGQHVVANIGRFAQARSIRRATTAAAGAATVGKAAGSGTVATGVRAATRMGVKVAAGAATGGSSLLARSGMRLAATYAQARSGRLVKGAGELLLPAARAHNLIADRKNQAVDAIASAGTRLRERVTDATTSARDVYAAARDGQRRSAATTGSGLIDKTLAATGGTSRIYNQARAQARSGTPTDQEPASRAHRLIAAAGGGHGRIEQVERKLTQPRRIRPTAPRNKPEPVTRPAPQPARRGTTQPAHRPAKPASAAPDGHRPAPARAPRGNRPGRPVRKAS